MRTVIIDDETQARAALKEEVDLIPEIELIGQADSVKSGIATIEELLPELVLLDIQLGDGMAFDLLEHFNREDKFHFKVIMTTAYSDYAIRAFKFNAVDYLLKPVDLAELSNAIDRVKTQEQATLRNFLYNARTEKEKRIAFRTSEGVRFSAISDIVRLNSEGNYTRILFKDSSRLMISKPLKEYDRLLSEYPFYRIHASHLINMDYFKTYSPKNGGEVLLKNGDILPVSQRRKAAFLKELEHYSL